MTRSVRTLKTPVGADTPPPFDCASGRHKVIGLDSARRLDGICVICGAKDVVDARAISGDAP